tara:strand:+ start:1844 stop:2254 length:411 start_codon:yes stop_codon:yes gene_type:complete
MFVASTLIDPEPPHSGRVRAGLTDVLCRFGVEKLDDRVGENDGVCCDEPGGGPQLGERGSELRGEVCGVSLSRFRETGVDSRAECDSNDLSTAATAAASAATAAASATLARDSATAVAVSADSSFSASTCVSNGAS